jgi:hypothetical protein
LRTSVLIQACRTYHLIGRYLNTLEGFSMLRGSLAEVNEVKANSKITKAPVLDAYLTSLEIT